MVQCVISKCNSRNGRSVRGEKISFHKFPVAKRLRMDWIRRIGQKNLKYSIQTGKTARLCSLHFTDDCYSVSRSTATSMGHKFTRWKLQDDAVPTLLFTDNPCLENVDCSQSQSEDNKMKDETITQLLKLSPNQIKPEAMTTVNSTDSLFALKLSNVDSRLSSNVSAAKSEMTTVSLDDGEKSVVKKEPMEDLSLYSESTLKTTIHSQEMSNDCESHGCTSSQNNKPSTNHKGMEVDYEQLHQTGNEVNKPKCVLQEQKNKKRKSEVLCEKCGHNYNGNQESWVLIVRKDNDTDDNCLELDVSSEKSTEDKKKNSSKKDLQKEKAAEASCVIKISLSDYEGPSKSTLFICACGFTAFSSEELLVHGSQHSIEETFTCLVCGDTFHNFLLMQQHTHKYQHYWTYHCKCPSPDMCPRTQSTATSIPVPGILSKPIPKPNSMEHPRSKPKPTSSSHLTNVEDHSSDGKIGAMDLTINGLKHVAGAPLKCGFCSYSSSSARDLLNHRKAHKAPPGGDALQSSNPNSTRKGQMEDNDSLKCTKCNFSTGSAKELLVHISFHGKEGIFRCRVCSYATKSAIDLLQHKKNQSCLAKPILNC